MLVAEKQQYMEPYYPERLDKEQPISPPRPRVVPKTRPKKGKKVLPVVVVLIGFSLCAFTVARFAIISQKQQEIATLEETLKKQLEIQEHLKLELAVKGDLQRIEEFAKTSLDMDYPNNEQVLFVELPQKHIKEEANIAMGVVQKESLWSRIVSLLD